MPDLRRVSAVKRGDLEAEACRRINFTAWLRWGTFSRLTSVDVFGFCGALAHSLSIFLKQGGFNLAYLL
jgi:hypothetical protein